AFHSRGLPGDDHPLRSESRRLEERAPVHARRFAREVRTRPFVVGVAIDGACPGRGVRRGDGRLEREHRMGALVRAIESAEPQYSRDVLLVAAALLDEAGLLIQGLVGPAEAETALQQEGAIALLAMDTVLDGKPKDRRRRVDAEVERIHVGAHGAAQQASERLRVAGRLDPGKYLLERS